MFGKGSAWVLACVTAFLLQFAVPGHTQIDKKEVDYDRLFQDGLQRRGKLLNLSGKKIGDEGVKRLVSSGLLEKVEKLELRYNNMRLISSARIRFEKMGPFFAVNEWSLGSYTCVPTMSAGSRSGVNCNR